MAPDVFLKAFWSGHSPQNQSSFLNHAIRPLPAVLPSGTCMDTSHRRRTRTWLPPCVWVVKGYYLASDYHILVNVHGPDIHVRSTSGTSSSRHVSSVSVGGLTGEPFVLFASAGSR